MERERQAKDMLDLIAEYLKSHGWNVVVIGGARVQKQPGMAEFNYEFVVGFTGSPPKDGKDGAAQAEVTHGE